MAEKSSAKKAKAPGKKVIRKVPNINLLKHLNVILLISGFLFSFMVIGLLSSRSDRYDTRSRGQMIPTVTPTTTPIPSTSSPTPQS